MLLRMMGLVLLAAACVGQTQASSGVDLTFIDHHNLRRMNQCDEKQLAAQVDEIKRNLDKAKDYGVGTYILFSRSFEFLVNYDFTAPELGDLKNKVYPADSEHRRMQPVYAKCVDEVIDHADKLGIKVIFHTNQFDFPRSLYDLAGQRISGSADVCPGKPLAFELLKLKIAEFFARFPRCSGLQLTLSETQAKVTQCDCTACKDLDVAERFMRVARTASEACGPLGKTLMLRTWGQFEKPEIVRQLPPQIICSTKFTLPDFHLTNYPNPVMAVNAERQEVEFDGWGEYSGYNLFPCYYGDLYVDRIRECVEKGVPRLGIRVNWDPIMRHIFSIPYGNECNIHVFSKLARNPKANPDDLLREYVAKVYPESAREAAFRLYKGSTDLQKTWLVWHGVNWNDHTRVYKGGVNRVRSQVGSVVPDTYADACRELDALRLAVDDAYEEAKRLIAALGSEVSDDWRRDLERGARTHWFVAQLNCDCIQIYAADRERKAGRPMPSIASLAESLRKRARLWETTDPELYAIMYGGEALKMLEEVEKS